MCIYAEEFYLNHFFYSAKSALGKGPDPSLRHGARKEMLSTERAHRITHRTSAIGKNYSSVAS